MSPLMWRVCGYNTNRFIFLLLGCKTCFFSLSDYMDTTDENICKDKVQHFKFSNATATVSALKII